MSQPDQPGTKRVAIGYARGVMGGLLVGIPSMMTMEMWWEGFFIPAWRLILLFIVNGGVLFILQHYSGLTHHKTLGISSTEEPLMIADQLGWAMAIGIVVLSLLQVYAIVFAVDFKQRREDAGTAKHASEVVRETLATYALAVLVGAYLLWTFETIGSLGIVPTVYAVVSLGLVTSLGAAAAELLI